MLIHVCTYGCVVCVCVVCVCVCVCIESARTEEGRQEFITDKYIELKYTEEEERGKIRQERQEARAESVRRSTKLTNQTSTFHHTTKSKFFATRVVINEQQQRTQI